MLIKITLNNETIAITSSVKDAFILYKGMSKDPINKDNKVRMSKI